MPFFIAATGIVVRSIAPHLRSKDSAPAVVVLDQKGRYVISLLSGHLGGANAMAREGCWRKKSSGLKRLLIGPARERIRLWSQAAMQAYTEWPD
ncbi:MAG: hypothetical protein JRI35_06870 [Deltaproteobacteria bacterium]|nr:hypothetical protein [Deltaproteobacteria bacterium]MBW1965792.1 hypothetical protein [Deltaproteobacteria bacterium]